VILIRVRIPYGLTRGYSLIGRTVILHIINLGSTPNLSIKKAQEAQLVERNSEDV
jgi:hypothetical protein